MADLDRQRAAHAWKCVQSGCTEKYTNLAKSAPALIMGNGLMPTLAFYQAKGKDGKDDNKAHFAKLLQDILTWLAGQKMGGSDFVAAMKFFHSPDLKSSDYRRATEEALELLRWIRHFAPAISGDPAED